MFQRALSPLPGSGGGMSLTTDSITAGNTKTIPMTDGVLTGTWNSTTYNKSTIGVYVVENGVMTKVIPQVGEGSVIVSYANGEFTVNYASQIYANKINLYVYS